MSTEQALQTRSGSKCECCAAKHARTIYELPPNSDGSADQCVYLCATCKEQVEQADKIDVHHWRCLNDCMWSEVPAVQVLAWRMLNRLKAESWAGDLLDALYLDEATQAWAEADGSGAEEDTGRHVDAHGAELAAGDTVTLIKDLNVKGAGFTAKRGTAVRGIALVADHQEHIEGRVNGQQIVILTQYVKKAK